MAIPKPVDTISEYKFRLIPEVAKAVYALRSKKEGQHARGEQLLYVDLCYIVQACDWIIASFLLVSHRVGENEAFEMMSGIMQFDTPLGQHVGNYLAFTITGLDAVDALLVLLFSKGGQAKRPELVDNLMLYFPKTTTYRAMKVASDNKLVFVDPDTNLLTLLPGGAVRAEQLAGQRLSG